MIPSWRVLWESRKFFNDKWMFFYGGGLKISKILCLYFTESCHFQEGSREKMFLKSRALDGKEDDSEPLPEPMWHFFTSDDISLEICHNPKGCSDRGPRSEETGEAKRLPFLN